MRHPRASVSDEYGASAAFVKRATQRGSGLLPLLSYDASRNGTNRSLRKANLALGEGPVRSVPTGDVRTRFDAGTVASAPWRSATNRHSSAMPEGRVNMPKAMICVLECDRYYR
jgi:hypothetical protein